MKASENIVSNDTEEVWRDIPNYEGKYQASSMGGVRTIANNKTRKERIHNPCSDGKGYMQVKLCKPGKQVTVKVHKLVAICFIPNPKKRKEINHRNGVKGDNRVENLEWCTRTENMSHADNTGLRKMKGEDSVWSKVTEAQVLEIRAKYKRGEYDTIRLAAEYNLHNSTVFRIIDRQSWKHI